MDQPRELPENLAEQAQDLADESLNAVSLDLQNAFLHQPLLSLHRDLSRGTSACSITNDTSQMAIIGAKFSPIESLDYEIVENDLFKQDWRSRTRMQILQYVILKWTLACLVGLLTGVTGFGINFAVENIAGYKLVTSSSLMEQHKYFSVIDSQKAL